MSHIFISRRFVPFGKTLLSEKSLAAVCSKVNYSDASSELPYTKIKTNSGSLRRGTGYRSSFNGLVVTIFGAPGFVGKNIVFQLAKHGTQVICAYRGAAYDCVPLKVGADLGQMLFTHFSIRDEDSIRKAVQYSDVVINLVGKEQDSMNFKMEEVHIDGARTIAKICREMGVKRLIHFSALNASPNPPQYELIGGSRFLKTKWHGEQAVREEYPNAVIVRPALIYGEEDRWINYIGSAEYLIFRKCYLYKAGEETIKQPVYVEDVAKGTYQLVIKNHREIEGKTYSFVGPKRYYLKDLITYTMGQTLRDEEWGFEVVDSRVDFFFHAYMNLRSFYFTEPRSHITWEKFDQVANTDTVEKGTYTLADLGMTNLDSYERHAFLLTRHLRIEPTFLDEPLEVDYPPPPPAAP